MQRHGQTRQQRRGGDPRPHRAPADDPDRGQGARLDAFQLGQLADRALGEEGVDQPLALVGLHQFHEELALALEALLEGQLAGRLNRAHRGGGRDLAAPLLQHRLIGRVEIHRLGLRHLADRAAGGAAVQQLLRIGQADLAGFALLHLVEDAQLQRLGRADMPAGGDQVERRLGAGQARQALGAAGAGQDAQVHLGQPEFGLGHGDAVMGRERHFETAAERGAMHRRDHQQRRGLDPVADLGQARLLRRLAEFADVGAGEIGGAVAIDHDRPGALVLGPHHAVDQPLPDREAERVDRRVLRLEKRDIPLAFIGDGVGHAGSPLSCRPGGAGVASCLDAKPGRAQIPRPAPWAKPCVTGRGRDPARYGR